MQSDKPAESENVQEETTPHEDKAEQAQEPTSEPGTSDGEPTAPAEPTEPHMPDPSALVAMVAMHMKTVDLLQVLLSVFDAHAWRSMGLVADHTGEINKDLPAAQTAIDCLAFVLGKVEGLLDDTEKRDVQRRLTDLRMNYVAKVREG